MTIDLDHIPVGSCPCCGSHTGTTLAQASALLAVCDVLVVRVLELIGKRIVRGRGGGRERYEYMVGRRLEREWHLAHTFWKPTRKMMHDGLDGAWDVVPAMLSNHGCCGVQAQQVTLLLDRYVRDMLITGTPHRLPELRYRLEKYLGVPLMEPPEPYTPNHDEEGEGPPLGLVSDA